MTFFTRPWTSTENGFGVRTEYSLMGNRLALSRSGSSRCSSMPTINLSRDGPLKCSALPRYCSSRSSQCAAWAQQEAAERIANKGQGSPGARTRCLPHRAQRREQRQERWRSRHSRRHLLRQHLLLPAPRSPLAARAGKRSHNRSCPQHCHQQQPRHHRVRACRHARRPFPASRCPRRLPSCGARTSTKCTQANSRTRRPHCRKGAPLASRVCHIRHSSQPLHLMEVSETPHKRVFLDGQAKDLRGNYSRWKIQNGLHAAIHVWERYNTILQCVDMLILSLSSPKNCAV